MANDVWSFSVGSNRTQLHGNSKTIVEIRNMADIAISKQISLYETQDNIKRYLRKKYGDEWYRQSAEAVQYIIEDAYSSAMRYKEMSDNYLTPVLF